MDRPHGLAQVRVCLGWRDSGDARPDSRNKSFRLNAAMKTSSAILTQTQRPQTMFGLPPALMMLSVSGGAAGLAVCVLMGVISVSLIVFISLTIGLWAWFWKHVREDCHYDRVLMQTPNTFIIVRCGRPFWGFGSTGVAPKGLRGCSSGLAQ